MSTSEHSWSLSIRPLSLPFAPHRRAHNSSVAVVKIVPMHLIGQLHAAEFGADLCALEFVKFLFGGSTPSERNHKISMRAFAFIAYIVPHPPSDETGMMASIIGPSASAARLPRENPPSGPQLDFLAQEPYLVTSAARLLPAIKTELVLLDPPLPEGLVSHGRCPQGPVWFEDIAPMGFDLSLPCLRISPVSAGRLSFWNFSWQTHLQKK